MCFLLLKLMLSSFVNISSLLQFLNLYILRLIRLPKHVIVYMILMIEISAINIDNRGAVNETINEQNK